MKQRIKKAAKFVKIVGKKLKGRSFNDFYNGKSVPRTMYNAGRFTVIHGPKATYRLLRRGFQPDGRIHFPNGLVSGSNLEIIHEWYGRHGKKAVMVIPSYNDTLLVTQCVESIAATVNRKKYHIIIVDDFCTEQSRKELGVLDERDDVTVVFRKENGGFSRAVNTGLRHALKHFPGVDVVLVNSDIVAHADWLAALQFGAYQHHKDVGIVGPKLLYPDGRIQHAGVHRNTELPEWFDHYYRFQPADYGPANVPQYCMSVTGAVMYIKANVLKKLGILDEKFPFAFEDVDFCLRAWEAGYRCLYFPAATLTHIESASRPKHDNLKPREQASVRYFWQKWGDWFDKRNVRDEQGRIRIIYVLQSTGVSGGHKVVFEHLNELAKRGYAAELWALDKAPTWTELEVPIRTFRDYDQLTKALSKEEAIKVASWWETALPVWIASLRKGIAAFVIHEVEMNFYVGNPEAQNSVAACYRKEFNNIISCSYTLDDIRSMGLNGTLIPCGYDSDIYKQLPGVTRDEKSLLALGRSFFQKNFKLTFAAWQSLGKKRPHLRLYGNEPKVGEMDPAIEYVTRPSDEEVNELFNKATVFVQTSYHEGFCLPILEAFAAGCPVICTDAHGNRDFSFAGKNCLMVDNEDVAGLAKAIDKLTTDEKLRTKLSKAGLETAKEYTWDNVMKKIDAYYQELADQPKHKYIKQAMKKYK